MAKIQFHIKVSIFFKKTFKYKSFPKLKFKLADKDRIKTYDEKILMKWSSPPTIILSNMTTLIHHRCTIFLTLFLNPPKFQLNIFPTIYLIVEHAQIMLNEYLSSSQNLQLLNSFIRFRFKSHPSKYVCSYI